MLNDIEKYYAEAIVCEIRCFKEKDRHSYQAFALGEYYAELAHLLHRGEVSDEIFLRLRKLIIRVMFPINKLVQLKWAEKEVDWNAF